MPLKLKMQEKLKLFYLLKTITKRLEELQNFLTTDSLIFFIGVVNTVTKLKTSEIVENN